ncbi:DUF4350 domain-containing protein [uncultured Thiothrix sp.]|jgi:hypothetical protein|uniref:DUF4350 domain-containing protein n=1 Tax=uncultured Thiothrix sp. TaxID=223185 RepID=UPI0026142DF6|nr:DUF4350 domain-containing protein [uncultured Thiothrix sp.]HMT94270.1 DUF4350 domain-containing protein [Thiolinea sp.]
MKIKWESVVIGLLALVVFALGCLWFVKNYELKEIDSYTGYRGEARSNDLFAARLFLKRMGIPTTRKDGLLSLPDTDTVIVLDTGRYTMTQQKTQTLLAWVAAGGHLVTRARVDYASEAELAADEDSQQKPETEERDTLQQALQIEIGASQMLDEKDLPFSLQLINQPKPLKLDLSFFNELLINNPNAKIYQANKKNFLIQIKHGQGLISLAATLEFAENHLIDKVDHAEFFWWLLHSHKADFKQVWLINQDTLPNLSTLLTQYAWPVLWMVAFLLLASFWALIPRFGAFIPEPVPERRRILEHIKASGQFMWKHPHESKHQLLDSTRQAIRQTARTHIPGWQWLEAAEQIEQLAQYLKHPSEQTASLHHLLTSPQLTDAEFIRLVQLANSLRKTI